MEASPGYLLDQTAAAPFLSQGKTQDNSRKGTREESKNTPAASEHIPISILSVWSAGLCFSSTSPTAFLSVYVPPWLPLIWFAAPFVSHLPFASHLNGSPSWSSSYNSRHVGLLTNYLSHIHVHGDRTMSGSPSPLIRPTCRPLFAHNQVGTLRAPTEPLHLSCATTVCWSICFASTVFCTFKCLILFRNTWCWQ